MLQEEEDGVGRAPLEPVSDSIQVVKATLHLLRSICFKALIRRY